jgi:hypothetical protein
MATNPLQKYFRQPKVFIKLPSGGIYSRPGTVQGDPTNVPVYGMTGMDEIIVRTPDALLSGESTATVVGSCVPAIKDPWDLCILDLVLILAAIRIATYGNSMAIGHTCTNCGAENDYDIDLNKVVEFYMNCQYESKIVLKDITINLKPLNYKASTEFNLRNFRLQQRIAQAEVMENTQERQDLINGLFKELAAIQTEIYKVTIDSVDIGDQVVTETAYILEWLDNCDKAVFDAIKQINQKNTDTWTMPKFPVKCDECETAVNLTVDLDQSNFFVRA